MANASQYANETLGECCRRVTAELDAKCEQLDAHSQSCLVRKVDFEERCPICRAAGLICYLRDLESSLVGARRTERERDELRMFQMHAVGNY